MHESGAQRDQVPANSGLFLPRQRIFFDGNITRRIEYEFSINRGLGGTINILNAYINLHFNDRFEIKIRPILHAAHVRPVRDFELLAADARAVALHDQRRPGPADRLDGLGLPFRQAARLRSRNLQRLT